MGALDQFIKEVFETETPSATDLGVRFEGPQEIPTTEIHTDGMLYLVNEERVKQLPFPWRLVKQEPLVLEFKMQGDHLDRYEYERALLRRQAAQCQYLKQNHKEKHPPFLHVWIVTGGLPEWMEDKMLIGQVALGCHRLEPSFYKVYLIAANELPLREDLIPFLITRTGQKLIEFCEWLLVVRPKQCEDFLKVAPMSDAQHDELYHRIKEPELADTLRRQRRFAESMAQVTGLQDDLLTEGAHKTLSHQFEKRLKRALTEEEKTQLTEKISRLGAERVSDVVLELTKDALQVWLQDPASV